MPLCFPLLYRRHFAYPHAKYLPNYIEKILCTPMQNITNQHPLILKPTQTLIVDASAPNCGKLERVFLIVEASTS